MTSVGTWSDLIDFVGGDAKARAILAGEGSAAELTAFQTAMEKGGFDNLLNQRGLNVRPILNSSAAASANRALLQAALNRGGQVQFSGGGVAYINGPLEIGSDTRLVMDDGLVIRNVAMTHNNLLRSACYNRPWLTASVAWTSGLLVTVTLASHGLTTVDSVWLRGVAGTADSAFTGVFPVVSVVDANTVTLRLRRRPAVQPSGTFQAKRADKNISIEGGVFDWNYAGGMTGAPGDGRLHGIILGGIRNLKLRGVKATDCPKYGICTGALAGYTIEDWSVFASHSDGLKLYGPTFDGYVRNGWHEGDDDGASVQCQEPADFTQYDFTGGGDCLNVKIEGITTPRSVAVYPSAAQWMDLIEVSDAVSLGGATPVAVKVASANVGARGGRLTITAPSARAEAAAVAVFVAEQVSFDHITVEGLVQDRVSAAGPSPAINVNTAGTIRKFTIRSATGYFPLNAYFAQFSGSSTIDQLEVVDSYFEGIGGTKGEVVACVGATIGTVAVRNSRLRNVTRIVNVVSGVVGPVTLEGNSGNVTNGVQRQTAGAVIVRDNTLTTDNSQGFVRTNGSIAVSITASGNQITGGWLSKVTGNEAVSVFSSDFQYDVTALARTNGAFCFNTNAAAGSLGQVGVVDCLGGATGSWRLRGDPTKSY